MWCLRIYTFHWIEIEIKNWIEIWLKLKIEIVDVVAQHIWHTFHWIEIDIWNCGCGVSGYMSHLSLNWNWQLTIEIVDVVSQDICHTPFNSSHFEIFILKSYVTRSVEVWQSQRLYFHNIETKLPKLTLLAPQSGAHRRGAFRDFQPNPIHASNPVPLIAFEHLSLYIPKHLMN